MAVLGALLPLVHGVMTADPAEAAAWQVRTLMHEAAAPTGASAMGNDVLVADRDSGRVLRIGLDGSVEVVRSGLNLPIDVAADSSGNIFVLEMASSRLVKIVPGQSGVTEVASGFNWPLALALDAGGSFGFVSDPSNDRIARVNLSTGAVANWVSTDYPAGLFVDDDGALLWANQHQHCVMRTSSGGGSTAAIAGSCGSSGFIDGPAPGARLTSPFDVERDGAGNLIVSANNSLRTVDDTGAITTLAGNGDPGLANGRGGDARFNNPAGVAVLSNGSVAVADFDNDLVRLAGPVTGPEPPAWRVTTGLAGLAQPTGVVADGKDVLVTERGNGRVMRVTRSGQSSIEQDNLYWPIDVALDNAGNMYVLEMANSRLLMFEPGSETPDVVVGGFNWPLALEVSPDGDTAYVADPSNDRIAKVTMSNQTVTTLITTDYPSGLYLDRDGSLLWADQLQGCVKRTTSAGSGTTSTIAGTCGSTGYVDGDASDVRLAAPADLIRDRAGRLYVTANHSLRVIHADGAVSTVAGNGTSGFFDGAGGEARFADPHSVAVTDDGTVAVGDFTNGRLRWVTPPGGAPPVAADQVVGDCDFGAVEGQTDWSVNPAVCRSDPVNTATGAFEHQVQDVALPGPGPGFAFTRAYSSHRTDTGPMGPGWTHAYSARLDLDEPGHVTFHADNGQKLVFTADGASYDPPPGATSTLSAVTGGFRLEARTGTSYRFDSQGRLTSVAHRDQPAITLTYGGGELASITDSAGRTLTVSHTPAGLVSGVSVPGGRSVAFGYTAGRLTSATDLAGQTTTYAYDSAGRLDDIVDPNGHHEVRNTYGTDGRVTSQLDPLGNETTFAWDQATETSTMTDAQGQQWIDVYSGNVRVAQIDPLGNATTFGYDSSVNLTSVTDPRDNTTIMSYDGRGNLLSRTSPAPVNATETFTYDNDNNLLTRTDARNHTTSLAYDTAGRLEQVTEPGAADTVFTYKANTKLVETVTDPRNQTTEHTYDTAGNLTASTSPEGNTTTHTYDTAGRRLSTVDPRGNAPGADPDEFRTTYTYNDADRLLTVTDPLDHTTTSTYDDVGNLLTETDPTGRQTIYTYNAADEALTVTEPGLRTRTFTYDSRGQLATETSPEGNITSYTYDSARRLESAVSPRGNAPGGNPEQHRTTHGYDPAGNLTSTTDPTGEVTTHTYDAANRRTSTVDRRGHTTTYDYNDTGDLTSVTDPLDHTTIYAYDNRGRLTTTTDPRGKTTTSSFDPAGNLTSETTDLGHTTSYTYDGDGRLTSTVEARGNATGADPNDYRTSFGYDRAGNLVSTTNPLGHETTQTWDRAMRLAGRTDAKVHTTSWAYDDAGRLTGVTAPDTTVTTYTHDPAGRTATRTDAKNHTTSWSYDLDDQLTTETTPIGTWTHSYDPDGNRATTTKPGAAAITYGYDRLNRQTSINYPDSTPDVAWTYDTEGNRATMTGGHGTVEYDWDNAGRLLSATRGTQAFNYTWDAADNLTQRTYPDTTNTNYTYNDDNQLATVTSGSATTSYSYDPAGRLTTTTYPTGNGHTETRTWDRAGRLTTIAATTGGTATTKADATLDPVGNPLTIQDADGTTTAYQYDQRDQLTKVCYAATTCQGATDTITYAYDPVGNLVTDTRPTGTTTYTVDAADRLTARSGPGGSATYTHDARGNRTSDGTATYTYDLADRLTTADPGPNEPTTTYTNDGDSQRITASTGPAASETTHYLIDPLTDPGLTALETDGNGTTTRRYTLGIDPISVTTGSNTSYLHRNLTGSIIGQTGATGAAEWTYTYEPFGAQRTATQGTGGPKSPLRFTGEHLDDSTGLYHLRARQYDPQAARFTAPDPAPRPHNHPHSAPYTYAENRPSVLTDPTGQRATHPNDNAVCADNSWQQNTANHAAGWLSDLTWNNQDRILGFFGATENYCENNAAFTVGSFAGAVLPGGSGKRIGKELGEQTGERVARRAVGAGTGGTRISHLGDDVAQQVDEAIERAAKGTRRFSGHDGKPFANFDGDLPKAASGYYTEWTAAASGAKRGTDRVIIGGDPSNPDVIYYWDHGSTFTKLFP